jgi:formylmethanofuran dehydrogenase subunit E
MLRPISVSKQRKYTRDLEDQAQEFHGHGGPFLIIGLRMGLRALKVLDSKGWFGLRCSVYLKWEPPVSCVIDGIQVSTGCTMGKHNIDIHDMNGVKAVFQKGEYQTEIKLRDETLSLIEKTLEDETDSIEGLLEWLRKVDDSQIFLLN